MHANVTQDTLYRMIAQIAVDAMQLKAAIEYLKSCICCEPFCRFDKPCSRRLACANGNRGAVQQHAGRIKFGREVRNTKLQRLKIGQPRSTLSALLHVVNGPIKKEPPT